MSSKIYERENVYRIGEARLSTTIEHMPVLYFEKWQSSNW